MFTSAMRHDDRVIDLAAVRADTPGCLDQVFLDSAGSALPTVQVHRAVVEHLEREVAIGGYRAAAERADDLAALPASLGRLLGCDPDLIALTDSATRAWDLFVTALPWAPGDRVLVCGTEYASNAIALLQRARLDGITVEVVPSGPDGSVDLAALEAMLDDRVRMVSLVHVPTNSGQVAPVAEVVRLAHRAGALVLLDACQSVGQLRVDVAALGVDALSATGRKWLRAPRGTGFLHVRREVLDRLEPAAADLRGATWTTANGYELAAGARRFELWEYDVAARLGMKVAVDQLLALGIDTVEATVRARAADLRAALAEIRGVTVRDPGPDLCGIVSFTVADVSAEEVRDRLAGQRVTVTVSGAGSTRLDMTARGLPAVVRASPHYFNGPEDLEAAAAAVAAVCR
jgi:cysteine desulfurase